MQAEKLKAERVQEPFTAGAIQERLKAERVQESLRTLPGWQLAPGGKAIDRVREFPDAHVAAAYAGFVTQFAARRDQSMTVSLSGSQVAVTLKGKARQGRHGGLTAAVLEFARALG